jgi:uncharacterized membrane protein YvbJ
MKHCPKCRVESRDDAEWCWHCGYAYEDEAARPTEPAQCEEQAGSTPDPDEFGSS